jgi:hypothetical protein
VVGVRFKWDNEGQLILKSVQHYPRLIILISGIPSQISTLINAYSLLDIHKELSVGDIKSSDALRIRIYLPPTSTKLSFRKFKELG